MSKYNLMDFYGSNWVSKIPEDKYLLSLSDGTVGKFDDDEDRERRFNLIYFLMLLSIIEYANDKKLQQDHRSI